MTMPRVSILVPAYNDAAYLEDALSSIAAQTVADYEVIIADDASTDATPEIASAWATRDARFRWVRNERNLGMAENWNRAFSEAQGEFVAKLDADDAFEPRFLEEVLGAFERRHDLLVSFCRTLECDQVLRPTAPWHGEGIFETAGLDPARETIQPGSFWFEWSFDDHQLWHSCAFLIRSADLRDIGGWNEQWSCAADTDLFLRLLEQGKPVAQLPYVGIRYRRRKGSVSADAARVGWKGLEGTMVCLGSLSRCRKMARRSHHLRKNWWRYWRNLAHLRQSDKLWVEMPARVRAKLEGTLAAMTPPPAWVLAENDLRNGIWRASKALKAKFASG